MNATKPPRTHLDALRKITTPTLSNAIELFNVRPRNQGFLSSAIRCLFPQLGVMVGRAVTARYVADQAPTSPALRYDLWKFLLSVPEPRVLVLQDMDQPAGVGAFVGEVMATIHQRLGCVGVVTNGCVRDLDEVRTLGFHMFASGPCVSHAYVELIDFGTPVTVGGQEIQTGDLLHADQHGVLCVPENLVPELPNAVLRILEREQRILSHCNAPDFSLEELRRRLEGP